MSDIQQKIEQERDQARATSGTDGDSGYAASSWDAVEELEAEASHQPKPKSSFEQYCDDNPSASECRVYEE